MVMGESIGDAEVLKIFAVGSRRKGAPLSLVNCLNWRDLEFSF